MTASPELKKRLEQRAKRVRRRFDDAQAARDEVIVDLDAAGFSTRTAGELVGLSHAGVAAALKRLER